MSENATLSAPGPAPGRKRIRRRPPRAKVLWRYVVAWPSFKGRRTRTELLSTQDPVQVLAAAASLAILVSLALLPPPFSAAHGFAILGALLSLLAVHRALLHSGGREKTQLVEFGSRIERRIEQLKDLQWEMSENEALYRDMLDSQDDMILRRDASGRLTFVNKSFCRVFDVEAESALGSSFTPTVIACDGPRRSEMQPELRRRRFVELVQTSIGQRWIEWEEQTVPSIAGAVDEVHCIGRDTTERRRAREELEDARDRAEAANRAKSRFLAAMSHEIRTPMNGIMGMASLLLESCDTPDEQTYARAIDQSARNLLVIIDEILDYSKIEAGKVILSSAPFRIDETIQSAVELMAPRAYEKGLEIAWSTEPQAARMVTGDEARVRQILLNLVSNAVKFTDTGGVLISAKLAGTAGEDEPVRLSISVQDTGIGLSEYDKKRLFDEFEQADAAIHRQSGGTGLGLAISRRIARAMNGDIQVSSSPGKGSTFVVDLLLERAHPVPAAPSEETNSADAVTVLLAFDGPLERKTLAATLDASKIKTIEVPMIAALGAIAAAAKSGRPIDRIVVEVNADPATAAILLKSAREHLAGLGRSADEARGIVLVNVLSRSSLAAFRERGFSAYLVRPVRPASLLEQLGVRARRPSPLPAPIKERVLGSGATPPRVLLVEDNDINELLARRILEKIGCDVISARNGAVAVSIMKAVRLGIEPAFSVVLMDILMPGMDGVEATRAIRELYSENAEAPQLPPIVALTANAFVEDRQRYMDAGMDDYLAKPFDKPAIEALLARWLPAEAGGKAA